MLTSLAFLSLLVSNSQGNILPDGETSKNSHLMFVFENIVTSITQKFTECSYFNYVQDVGINPHELTSESDIMLNLDLHPNATQVPTTAPQYNYKHNLPCSIVFFEIQEDAILDSAAAQNSSTAANRWPLGMLTTLPSSTHESFFIFFSNKNHQVQSSKLNQLLHLIAPIQHAVFIISQISEGKIDIYKGVSLSEYPLEKIATSTSTEDFKQSSDVALFSREYVDFNGATIKYMQCMVCKQDYEEYLQRGRGGGGLGFSWQTLVNRFNGSVEFEEVFEIPGQGVQLEINENNQEVLVFNEMMFPVAEGYAAITAPLINAQYVQKVVWLSRPLGYASVYFMTAKPQLQQLDSLSVLLEPLDYPVWLGFLLSFLACALFMCFVQRRKKGKGDLVLATGALFRPIVNQSSSFEIESGAPKAVFGLWLLFMLTLGCGYNSKIIASIVTPRYTSVPRTFKQLADSDYDIGIVAPDAIKEGLMRLNTTVSLKIAERGQELDLLNSMSYMMPFYGSYACIAPWVIFQMFGLPVMVDVDGKILSVRSEEGILTSYGQAAISRHYPMIIEPLDRLLGLVDQSGLNDYARKFQLPAIIKRGRQWAKANAHARKFYSRQSASTTDDSKVVGIVLSILQFGFAVAATVFFTEVLPKVYQKMKKVWKAKLCKRTS